jgi:hypothetical protein
MKTCNKMVVFLFAQIAVAGCASTNVTQQTPMGRAAISAQRQLFLPFALTHDFCYRVGAGCLT